MLVTHVVGDLELVEGDDLLHPLLAGGRAVRVDVHPLRHLRVRLTRHNPGAGKTSSIEGESEKAEEGKRETHTWGENNLGNFYPPFKASVQSSATETILGLTIQLYWNTGL